MKSESMDMVPLARKRSIIRALTGCYAEEIRRAPVQDFFATKIRHHMFMTGEEELINGHLSFVPLPAKKAQAAQKNAYLYRKEKELLYGSLFLTGFVGEQFVASPLISWPADIRRSEHFLDGLHKLLFPVGLNEVFK